MLQPTSREPKSQGIRASSLKISEQLEQTTTLIRQEMKKTRLASSSTNSCRQHGFVCLLLLVQMTIRTECVFCFVSGPQCPIIVAVALRCTGVVFSLVPNFYVSSKRIGNMSLWLIAIVRRVEAIKMTIICRDPITGSSIPAAPWLGRVLDK